MNNKNVKKIDVAFKALMWLYLVDVGFTVYLMIAALVTQEVTVFNYAMVCVANIGSSLLLAFICSRTKVTYKDEEK